MWEVTVLTYQQLASDGNVGTNCYMYSSRKGRREGLLNRTSAMFVAGGLRNARITISAC